MCNFSHLALTRNSYLNNLFSATPQSINCPQAERLNFILIQNSSIIILFILILRLSLGYKRLSTE
jgi:hypothetical protein